jgi:DNA-binding FadR family transcriptional regulator
MPRSIRPSTIARAAVFAPLAGAGRAQLVEQRLTDAIMLGLLTDGERLPREADLARRFGVATVTAREALDALRQKGLVKTTRGRDGGSFVTAGADSDGRLIDTRVRSLSRVELRDMGVYYGALAASSAEIAADRASQDDVESLHRAVDATDHGDAGAARRGEGGFHLEIAALTQSARIVREELRLQAELGPLLWLSMSDDSCRRRGREAHLRIVDAISKVDGDAARQIMRTHVAEELEWLVAHRAHLERRG